MVKHIIIGAGLGGLYEANRLINLGVSPENIVIIEERDENQYTRPGHLNPEVFELVNRNTKIQTPHSTANHIKELERVMYKKLSSLNVKFINEKFIGLQAGNEAQVKAVITRKKDGSEGIYPADYVFDCTGRKAWVAQAVNAYRQSINSQPVFEKNELAILNPIDHHLVAQVLIPDHSSLAYFVTPNGEPVPSYVNGYSLKKKIELREKLRELGWHYEAFPTFYSYPQNGSDKVCLYMETPANLPENKQGAWMELLLDIYSKGKISTYSELKPSVKYGKKPRIVGFKSEPYVLTKVVHDADNLPVVVVGFDALKGFDYRLANGVISGIECCELMLRHITISEGRIQNLDSAAIEKETMDYIHGTYKNHLTAIFTDRQKAIENAWSYFSYVYFEEAKMQQDNADIIQKYQSIVGELATQAVNVQFSQLKERSPGLGHIIVLNEWLDEFIRARMACGYSAAMDNKLHEVIQRLYSEIKVFDLEQTLAGGRVSNKTLKNLFESILFNLEDLEGLEDLAESNFIQNSAKMIIEKNKQIVLDRLERSGFFSTHISNKEEPTTSAANSLNRL